MPVACGVSLLPAEDLRRANAPLFEEGLVDAIEWSVDFGFAPSIVPEWVIRLLAAFEDKGALFAHGVELSPMSASLAPHQHAWLDALRDAFKSRRYRHFTEHYGFLSAGDVVRGTPLPLPPSRAVVDVAVDRIRALADLTGAPVGIENLAFAFGPDDAVAQAETVREICERSGAFLLFDVHNLYCQIDNFDLDPLALAELYGLERVREIHVAGGALTTTRVDPTRPFRRDSHDESVPAPAFELLAQVLPRCPNLEVVILERSDRSTFTEYEAERHRADFRRMREIVAAAEPCDRPPPTVRPAPELSASCERIADDREQLARYQDALLASLQAGGAPQAIQERLGSAPLAAYGAYVSTFEPRAVEIGAAMAAEWCARDPQPGEMDAAVLRAPGLPLSTVTLPIPEPGPGQALVRPLAVGLCGTDAHACAGRFPVPTPIVLGHEIAGVVEALGPGSDGLAVGDRVGVSWIQRTCGACPACRRGQEARCVAPRTWVENGGGLSELVVVESTGCTKLPPALPVEVAAPLFCAGHVAMSAFRRAMPAPGERVAVVGLGGLGHLAIQIARALDHEVIALTSTKEKLRDALALGATAAVPIEDDAGEALEAAGGADVVLATTSSMHEAAAAARGLRVGGRLVLVGLGDGPLSLDPIELVQREASVVGAVQGPRSELDEVLALAARGLVTPRVECFPRHLANRALGRLAAGRVRYRAVIYSE